MMGVGQLRWQCYRRHQQNPWPCPDSVVLAGEKKKKKWGEVTGHSCKNIIVSDTKLTLPLEVGFIIFLLTAHKLFPVNPREITGAPNTMTIRARLTQLLQMMASHKGQGCCEDWTHKFCLTPQTPKPAFRNNHTQTWVDEMLHTNLVHKPPSIMPEATQVDQILEPGTQAHDVYQRPKSQNITECHTETTPRSGH